MYKKLFQEIESLHRSQDKLLHGLEYVAHAIEGSFDLISFVNKNYRYVSVNPSYSRIHNRELNQFWDLSVAELHGADVFKEKIKPHLDQCFSGNPTRYQAWFPFATGRRYMDVTYVPIYNGDNHVEVVAVCCRDISHQQEQLEEMNNKLTHLENLNSHKDKLVSIISHDVCGPLASMVSLFDLLDTVDNYEEMKELLEGVSSGVRNTLDMVQNLMKWSSTQINGAKLQTHCFSIFELINERLEQVSINSNIKNVTIENLTAPHLKIFADAEYIGIVLTNLVNNAIKFVPRFTGKIELLAQVEDDDIIVSVNDNGVGLDPTAMEKINQARPVSSKEGTIGESGNGLGLIICNDLLFRMNSRLKVRPSHMGGACFFFKLKACTHQDGQDCDQQ